MQDDYYQMCQQCKVGCCQGVRPPITREREKLITHYLRTSGLDILDPFTRTSYTFPRETPDGYCIFYARDTKKCRIHAVKPETCVAGPITFDIDITTATIQWFLKNETVCLLTKALARDTTVFDQQLRIAKQMVQSLLQALDRDALRTILNIEEEDTHKIDEDPLEPTLYTQLIRDVGQ